MEAQHRSEPPAAASASLEPPSITYGDASSSASTRACLAVSGPRPMRRVRAGDPPMSSGILIWKR